MRALTGEGRQVTYWDEVLPGFGVRVTPKGRKSFVVRYRAGGRRPRVTIGTYPTVSLAEARRKARELLGLVAGGVDPAARLRTAREGLTFRELGDLYLDRHAKLQKRSWAEDERILSKDLLPVWGHLKATSIRRPDVHGVLDRVLDRGAPVMANRTRALISKVFAFGVSRGLVEHNPAYGVPRPAREQARERVLTDQEVAGLWRALGPEDEVAASVYRLRLLTAQRGIEVRSMRWADIAGGWWTVRPEVAKSGRGHRVPLSPAALTVLDGLRPYERNGWVFPGRNGSYVGKLPKATNRLRERMGVHDWRPHDLRRTAATGMARQGTSRLVVAKILNHSDSSITAVYERATYEREKREALERWGSHVWGLVQ